MGVEESTLVDGGELVLETELCRPVEIGRVVVELDSVDPDRDDVEELEVPGGIPLSMKK